MKILIAVDKYYPAVNGVITSVMTLRKALLQKGHEVKVLTLSESRHSYEEKDITYIGSFDISRIYPEARLSHPTSRKYITHLIDWHPDIVHTNTEFSSFHLAKEIARSVGCPLVHTYHTDYEDYTHYIYLRKKFGARIVKRYISYVASTSDAMIAPTPKTEATLRKYGIKLHIQVIPTGLDLDKYKVEVTEAELEALRAKYHIKAGVPTMLFVGRLGKEKNISEIIQLLAEHKNIDFQFVLVGDGPDRNELVKQVEKAGLSERTVFTGMVSQEDIQKYYRLGDLFLSASQSETQGLTYIEALCAGIPLLCRKDPCLEGVVVDGYNGWCFENAEEFNKYLADYLGNVKLQQSMKQNAQKYAYEHFGSEVFADNVLDLYQNTMADYKPHHLNFFQRLYYRSIEKLPLV